MARFNMFTLSEIQRKLQKFLSGTLDCLTLEQEALIHNYQEKWRKIAFSTESIDRQKSKEAIKAAYKLIGKTTPDIIFCNSPSAIINAVTCSRVGSVGFKLNNELENRLRNLLKDTLNKQLDNKLQRQLQNSFGTLHSWLSIWWQLKRVLQEHQPELQIFLTTDLQAWFFDASWFDFCISVVNCDYQQKEWEVFQSLLKDCGWIYPFERAYIVCDRPIKLSFDNENSLHSDIACTPITA